MANAVSRNPAGQSAPEASNPLGTIARFWRQISPSFVPVLAVLTALIVTIPVMVVTGAKGDIGRGLNIAFTAYAASVEGSTGLAINQILKVEDIAVVQQLAADGNLDNTGLRQLAARVTTLKDSGPENMLRYAETIRVYEGKLDAVQIDLLGERIPTIRLVGADTLRAMQPFVDEMSATLSGAEALNLARQYATESSLTDEQRSDIVTLLPSVAEISDGDLLAYLNVIVQQNGIGFIRLLQQQLAILDGLGVDINSEDATNFAGIFTLKTQSRPGAENVLQLETVENQLVAAGITDEILLAQQLDVVNALYSEEVLTNNNVATALATELQPFLDNNFVVYRPGNQPLLINPDKTGSSGIIYNPQNTPDDLSDDKPDTLYLRFGDNVLLFFPARLELTLRRAIPFVIAGLAVALGFKAGLFNIGAEGQLYIGGLLSVWIGFSPIFDGLPAILRIPLVLLGGIIGGGLWGMLPGALKAFTGAHEVINTIMLNLIAIRFVDWIIRSDNPVILRDLTASNPRTPEVSLNARLPHFDDISAIWFVLAGIAVLAFMLWQRRESLAQNRQLVIRPMVYGVLTIIGGFFLSWLTVSNELHLGLVVMILTVLMVQWFLDRTIPGFELRTVGSNPNAAKYAGMNVRWNIILALGISGMLAGLAGAIEISSVQFSMQPEFFAGLGFDAIAVALLARQNPRNMIAAGLLWSALLIGAPLMQTRADIAIDLVKIIQALIIMFIAADTIVRGLWRVPEAKADEKMVTFSKGWGG